MRVLDDPDDVAEGVFDRRDEDSAAHIRDRLALLRAEFREACERGARVGDAPVGDDAVAGDRARGVGVEAEFVAADVEADVERLVEVRPGAEQRGVPLLRPRESPTR